MATLKIVGDSGQSLDVGSQGAPAISTTTENANAFLINVPGGALTALFRDSSGPQRPALSMMYRIADANAGQRYASTTNGMGAQTISQLSKGGSSGMYENTIAAMNAAKTAEIAAGGTVLIDPFHFIQGEQDQVGGTAFGTYKSRVLQYRTDLSNDTNGGIPIPFIMSQTATWAYYGTEARIGLAQLDLARTLPDVYALAQYQLPYASDGLHMTRVGYYRLGELHARIHNAVTSGLGWKPFAPKTRVLNPSSIVLKFDVPSGSLAFDTTVVAAQPNYGFSLSGTAATITSVTITASDEITIGISQPITEPGSAVGYGVKYGTGPGLGNLRDSETAVSKYDNAPLANWALHFSDDLGIPQPEATKLWVTSDKYLIGPSGALYQLSTQAA